MQYKPVSEVASGDVLRLDEHATMVISRVSGVDQTGHIQLTGLIGSDAYRERRTLTAFVGTFVALAE
jgi:hypothetical protein